MENPDRPHHKLPYRGAWLWIGPEMIHLMELPNPDPMDGRPEVRALRDALEYECLAGHAWPWVSAV